MCIRDRIFGEPPGPEDSSLVDVVLDPDGDGGTRLTLTHTAVVAPDFWDRFGPGAVGVGWDLTLVGLGAHLAGEVLGTQAEMEADPAVRAGTIASSEAWGEAYRAAGADPATAAAATAATTEAYVPPEA